VCRYTTQWNINVLKATNENKMISVTTHCKKLTTRNKLFIVSVIVQSNLHLEVWHQLFNMSALLLDDALNPVTPLTKNAINQTLRQFVPLSDDCLLQLLDHRELSTLIDHLLKAPKQHNRPDFNPGCLETIGQACSVVQRWSQYVSGLSAMSDISLGSVAPHLKRGGILSDSVTPNFSSFGQ